MKISIIMPAYNSSLYISESIESVLAQTYTDWELLITDDCSTDNTYEIIKDYEDKDSRIKGYRLDNNSGAAIARNHSLARTTGRFVTFLDSDDLWLPNKLELQLNHMIENDIAFSYSDYFVMKNKKQILFKAPNVLKYKDLLSGCDIGCLTVMLDSAKFNLNIVFPTNAFKREDYALWLYLLKNVECAIKCSGFLAKYRITDNSVSSKKIRLIAYQWNVLRHIEKLNCFLAHVYLIKTIIKKIFKGY